MSSPSSSKLTVAQRIAAFFTNLIPFSKRTAYDYRQAPMTLATSLDVDRVHAIFNEAQTGNVRDLFTLYRDIIVADNHIQTEFSKRKLAVLGDVLTSLPADKTQPLDGANAAAQDAAIKATPGFMDACIHLLDSCLWPVAIVEKIYAPTPTGYRIAKLVPVPYELLDYSFGYLRIWDTDPATGLQGGTAQVPDPARYIIHRGHLLSATLPDNWGGPMRSLVFWWLLGAMDRDWWSRFLDRYGSPFVVGKYEQGDDVSRSILQRAFSYATKLGGLVVSKETEVELIQTAAGNSGEAYAKFLEICQDEKSKLICGQTSSHATSGGLGSGVSNQQEGVRQDYRQWDAVRLATTLRDQLFTQYFQINNLPGGVPTLSWGGESSKEQLSTGTLLESLAHSGVGLTDAGIAALGQRLGLLLQRAPVASADGGNAGGGMPFGAPAGLSAAQLTSLATTLDAHVAQDDIARAGSADLARAFRGSLAPVRRMIALSRSQQELEASLKAWYPDWPAEKTAKIVESALVAYAASGAAAPGEVKP